jgi:hypothetical protein
MSGVGQNISGARLRNSTVTPVSEIHMLTAMPTGSINTRHGGISLVRRGENGRSIRLVAT